MKSRTLSLAPMLLLWTGTAYAAPEWRVTEVSGNVRLTQGKDTHPAFRGTVLAAGDVIATAPGARAVVVRGEEYVIISSNSQLRLPTANAGGVTQMVEDFGNALFRIVKKATPHFGVETPYLAAVVKGTTFSVTVSDSGASVQVLEGAVEVATKDGGARELVQPGVVALVGARDRMRLTIEGSNTRNVDSPARAAGPAPVPVTGATSSADPQPSAAPASAEAIATKHDAPSVASAAPALEAAALKDVVISTPVAAESTKLSEVTAGLVKGDTGVTLAFSTLNGAKTELAQAETIGKTGVGSNSGTVSHPGPLPETPSATPVSDTGAGASNGKGDAPKTDPKGSGDPGKTPGIDPNSGGTKGNGDTSPAADTGKGKDSTPANEGSSSGKDQSKAADDAAKAADKASKDQAKADVDAAKAAADAADKAAKDPVKADADPAKAADKAAKDQAKADADAAKAAADAANSAAKDPAKADSDPAKAADKAAKDQAKADADAAKAAADAADKAAKDQAKADADTAKAAADAADKATKDQAKADADAAKAAKDAAKGKDDGSLPGKPKDATDKAAKLK